MRILNSTALASQAGGQVKTFVTQLIEAAVTYSGYQAFVIDADAANGGHSELTGDPRAAKLHKLGQSGLIGEYIGNAAAAGGDVILDTAAGALTMDATCVTNLRDVQDELGRLGFNHTTVCTITSNKPVSEKIFNQMIKRYERFGKVVVATADLSGSSKFPSWLKDVDCPIVKVPVIAAGYVDLRSRTRRPLSSWLMADDEGQVFAKAAFAGAINAFLSAPALSHLVNAGGLQRLALLCTGESDEGRNPITAADASDPVIRSSVLESAAFSEMYHAASNDVTHPYHVVQLLARATARARRVAALTYPPTSFDNSNLSVSS